MLWITVCLVVISLTGRPGFALSSTNCHCKRIFFNNVLADNRDRSEYPWQVSLGDDHWADLTLQTMNITTDHLECKQIV